MNYANVANPKGRFQWIDKTLLDVPLGDKATQRSRRSEKTVKDKAENWDWVLCGAITVIEKSDGRYMVIDGGTRTEAAKSLNGSVPDMPCMVYSLAHISDRAKAFLGMNKYRTNVSAIDAHRNAVMARDPLAIKMNDIVVDCGYKVTYSGILYSFQSVATLARMVAKDEEIARNAFYLCTDIARDGETIPANILKGIFELEYILAKTVGKKQTIFTSYNEQKLKAAGIDGIMHEINSKRFKSATKTYSAEVCGLGVMEVINKKRRSGKLRANF